MWLTSSLCKMVLICDSATVITSTVSSWHVHILAMEIEKSLIIIWQKVKKYVHKQSCYPAYGHFYILIHGREVLVLVQLDSQHKRTKRSVWLVEPESPVFLWVYYYWLRLHVNIFLKLDGVDVFILLD